jgi:hypothetical protein
VKNWIIGVPQGIHAEFRRISVYDSPPNWGRVGSEFAIIGQDNARLPHYLAGVGLIRLRGGCVRLTLCHDGVLAPPALDCADDLGLPC